MKTEKSGNARIAFTLYNRMIVLLLWVIVLLWVYSRNRLTREEHIERESQQFADAIGYDGIMQKYAEDLENDPQLRELHYKGMFDDALEEAQKGLNDDAR